MMKCLARLMLPMALPLLIGFAHATPDHKIVITEHVLGTNSEGFVILRCESDNLGSYYETRETRYLDIYQKNVAPEGSGSNSSLAFKASTVLLMDHKLVRHPDNSPSDPPKTISNEEAKIDRTLALADVVSEYPNRVSAWNKEKFTKLRSLQNPGTYAGNLNIVWGGWIKERLGFDRNAEIDWKLEEVSEDANCLFMKVSTDSQSRWICILPETSAQVHAHLNLSEFYLVAGSFPDGPSAIAHAKAIHEKCREKKFFGFEPEIWSTNEPNGKPNYLVVDGLNSNAAEGNSFRKLEEILETDLEVRSSGRFVTFVPWK